KSTGPSHARPASAACSASARSTPTRPEQVRHRGEIMHGIARTVRSDMRDERVRAERRDDQRESYGPRPAHLSQGPRRSENNDGLREGGAFAAPLIAARFAATCGSMPLDFPSFDFVAGDATT